VSPRGWQERVRDILDAIAEIREFTRDMKYETFKDDDKSIRAVEMNFIILAKQQTKSLTKSKKNIRIFRGILCAP